MPDGICGSDGAWAACDECAALIESGAREELIERCLDMCPDEQRISRGRARKLLKVVHRHFFKKRAGSVERILSDANVKKSGDLNV
jgi:hypothetical protein